jgi:hypothetical protein
MLKKIAIVITATIIPLLGVVAAVPASAATAPRPHSPTHCTTTYYYEGGGQGIAVNCTDVPPTGYQVIAQCLSIFSTWQKYGTIETSAAGESVAVCHGWLVYGAKVAGYHVRAAKP